MEAEQQLRILVSQVSRFGVDGGVDGIFTKELKDAAADLKKNEEITIRQADKTAAFVLIKTEEYFEKLDDILADTSKFERLTRNHTEDIKRDANCIITAVNAATNACHLPPIQGDYSLGYLYGNVKTHKTGNPLRPIISQTPAPTYDLAKRLNKILTPYTPSKFFLTSSTEFLEKIRDSPGDGTMASLDVESLFTNFPVDETIGIILEKVYRNPDKQPPNIPEESLKTLLDICTKRASFTTHEDRCFVRKAAWQWGPPWASSLPTFTWVPLKSGFFRSTDVPGRMPDTSMTYLFKLTPRKRLKPFASSSCATAPLISQLNLAAKIGSPSSTS
ncbi:uncharacterized protein LOC135203908 [Macrobrachium nipponense]|uniref:uncharacterized protein LOC135203908 n=1 Tax=Macrobrachium nipponense TaxID=159736 RepID=UPI0030C7FE7A